MHVTDPAQLTTNPIWSGTAQAMVCNLIEDGALDERLFDRLVDGCEMRAEARARAGNEAIVWGEDVDFFLDKWDM